MPRSDACANAKPATRATKEALATIQDYIAQKVVGNFLDALPSTRQ
jgi:hypothetical protein